MSETYESILSRMQGRFQELAGFPADDASDKMCIRDRLWGKSWFPRMGRKFRACITPPWMMWSLSLIHI